MNPLARRLQKLETARRTIVKLVHPVFIAPTGCTRPEFEAFGARCQAEFGEGRTIFVLPRNGREGPDA